MKNTQKVPYEGMKAIYDIACDSWKKKIKAMTSVFEDTELTEEQVQEMFIAASLEQKQVLNKWIKLPENNLVSKAKKALEDLVLLPYPGNTDQEKSINATVKAFKIADIFNEGTKLSWEDTKTYKYSIYKSLDDGFCFNGWGTDAFIPVGLCFKSSDLAILAYENFPEIYNELLMVKS